MATQSKTLTSLQEIVDHFQGKVIDQHFAIVQHQIALCLLMESLGEAGGPVSQNLDNKLAGYISDPDPNLKNVNLLQDMLNSLRGEPDARHKAEKEPHLRLIIDDPEQ
jgi:hypothetical protein